jgi:hypothetical protein
MKILSLLCILVLAAACSAPDQVRPASTVKVVPHEKLLEFLPTLPGWTRGEPRGTTDTDEAVSRVQVDYNQDQGIGGLSIEIMDTTMNADILGPLTEFLKANRTETVELGTKKVTTVAGYPGTEEWTPEAGNGVVGILVANRFVVTVTGNSVGDVGVIRKVFDAIDVKKLAALK